MNMKKLFSCLLLLAISFFALSNESMVRAVTSSVTIDISSSNYFKMMFDSYLPNASGTTLNMHKKIATTGYPVYCADQTRISPIELPEGTTDEAKLQTWTLNGTPKNASQLAYIYNNGYNGSGYKVNKYMTGDVNKDYFITAMAVWKYTIPGNSFNNFDLTNGTYNGGSNDVSQKIAALVNDAANASAKNPVVSLSVSNTKMTLSGNYYVSSGIIVNGSDIDTNISVSLSGATGAFVTSNKDATSGSTSFAPGTTVYVKVPKANVNANTSITLNISASGTIRTVYLYKHSDSNIQSLTSADPEDKQVTASTTLSVEVKTTVTISKRSTTGSEEVPGATLTVKQGSNVISTWTSTSTPKELTLAPGAYTLTETMAPKGYIKSEETINFTVNADGSVDGGTTIIMKNKPIMVVFSKRTLTGSDELAGAKLKVTDSNGKVVTSIDGKTLEWTSSDKPVSFHLAAGSYTLIETTAPNGYIKSENVKFTVNDDGTVTVNKEKVSQVIMKDAPITVTISKRSINGKTELPGAKLKITDEKGTLVKDLDGNLLEWTSTTKEKTFHLAAGTYILTETLAPEGYELSETQMKFTINADGQVLIDKKTADDNLIIFTNTPLPVQVPTGTSVICAVIILGVLAIGAVMYFVIKKDN